MKTAALFWAKKQKLILCPPWRPITPNWTHTKCPKQSQNHQPWWMLKVNLGFHTKQIQTVLVTGFKILRFPDFYRNANIWRTKTFETSVIWLHKLHWIALREMFHQNHGGSIFWGVHGFPVSIFPSNSMTGTSSWNKIWRFHGMFHIFDGK